MEFMHHLELVNRLWKKDHRILLEHISLYHALFTWWFYNREGDSVAISHERMMRCSGIKSYEVYAETLEELNQYGYIVYTPSPGKGKPSTVSISKLTMDARVFVKEFKIPATDDQQRREMAIKQLAGDIIEKWLNEEVFPKTRGRA
jgi:hypothetical protein